jgi:hypothetical protein
MRKIPEYLDSADRPVVDADIFAREDPDDEEDEEEDDEKEDREDNEDEEDEDEGYSV